MDRGPLDYLAFAASLFGGFYPLARDLYTGTPIKEFFMRNRRWIPAAIFVISWPFAVLSMFPGQRENIASVVGPVGPAGPAGPAGPPGPAAASTEMAASIKALLQLSQLHRDLVSFESSLSQFKAEMDSLLDRCRQGNCMPVVIRASSSYLRPLGDISNIALRQLGTKPDFGKHPEFDLNHFIKTPEADNIKDPATAEDYRRYYNELYRDMSLIYSIRDQLTLKERSLWDTIDNQLALLKN